MRRVNHIASPEKGQQQAFKRYLLRATWRYCEGCGLHPRNLIVRYMEKRIAWVCKSCSGKLIYCDWVTKLEQDLTAYHSTQAEEVLVRALTEALPRDFNPLYGNMTINL
jgi:hypothetical protein